MLGDSRGSDLERIIVLARGVLHDEGALILVVLKLNVDLVGLFSVGRLVGLCFERLDHAVEALDLSVGPTVDIVLSACLFQGSAADPNLLCGVGKGQVEKLGELVEGK